MNISGKVIRFMSGQNDQRGHLCKIRRCNKRAECWPLLVAQSRGQGSPPGIAWYMLVVPAMSTSRRDFLQMSVASLVAVHPSLAFAQGVADRHTTAQPRGAKSGLPVEYKLTDVAAQAGLHATTVYGPIDHKDYIMEAVGCGCAFIDYDNDGWIDIFLLCGTRHDAAPADATNRLYHNNRDGTFTDITQKAGLAATGWASAVCVGDYNNDGFEDLFITYFGQNRLYRNNGNGTFTNVTKEAGLTNDPTRWGSGCTFVDLNRNGRLDLFVANYTGFDFATVPRPGSAANCTWKGVAVSCGPRGLPTGRHSLYRNNGNGTFTDISHESGVMEQKDSYGMTAVAADFSGHGQQEIYLASDSTPSLFFVNTGKPRLDEQGVMRGVALSDDGEEQAGMGIAVGDYNLDGRLDIFKTHFSDDTNVLYRNEGDGSFTDVTFAARLGVETRYTGWGTGMVDLDNNGFPDLFLVTGSVYPEIEKKIAGYPYKSPRIVFRNLGKGVFEELIEEAGPGVAATHSSRGCAFGDFDNDGDMDMLIINLNEPPSLLRNDVQNTRHWIKVKLVGVTSNRSAIGARVLVHYGDKLQAQSVMSQSSFYSASDLRLHFGIGEVSNVDVDVFWPSSGKQTLHAVPANQLVTIKEGVGIVANAGWTK